MSLDDLFGDLKDRRVPGGCDQCDAFQTFDVVSPGVHVIRVHHDDRCRQRLRSASVDAPRHDARNALKPPGSSSSSDHGVTIDAEPQVSEHESALDATVNRTPNEAD